MISDCTVYDTRICAIGIMEVDGGICENVTVRDIRIDNVKGAAIFVRLNKRSRPLAADLPEPPVGALRNILICNVSAKRIGGCCSSDPLRIQRIGCSLSGIPGRCVEGITIRDVTISFIGGGSPETCLDPVPETETVYPNCCMFGGDLPAYGFYCRHVRNLHFENLTLSVEAKDTRPAIVLDDVQDCRITGVDAQIVAETEVVVRGTAVENLVVSDCLPRV